MHLRLTPARITVFGRRPITLRVAIQMARLNVTTFVDDIKLAHGRSNRVVFARHCWKHRCNFGSPGGGRAHRGGSYRGFPGMELWLPGGETVSPVVKLAPRGWDGLPEGWDGCPLVTSCNARPLVEARLMRRASPDDVFYPITAWRAKLLAALVTLCTCTRPLQPGKPQHRLPD